MRPFALTLLPLLLAGAADGPLIGGIDHVPVAVADLEAAGARFRALGFAIKPGRAHANGIRNLHVKFPDATEIELITAPAAVDALTRFYRAHLAQGDGPGFAGFYTSDRDRLALRLREAGVMPETADGMLTFDANPLLSRYFFGSRQASPTDLPAHFAHPNTAYSVSGVWLAESPRSAIAQVLRTGGGTFDTAVRCTPDCVQTVVARIGDGEVMLLGERRRRLINRPIIGVTVAVRSIATARRVLINARTPFRERQGRLLVAPAQADGTWIEFRQR